MIKIYLLLTVIITATNCYSQINNALIPVTKLENDFYNWNKRHNDVMHLTQKQNVDLVFIGDSITHMFGGEPKSKIIRGGEFWKSYYAKFNPINMGFGWDRTQNVLWRITNGELENISPKVVVLMIGTNNFSGTKNARKNTPKEVAEAIEKICKTIHQKLPEAQILLLSILPRKNIKYIPLIQKTNKLISSLSEYNYIHYLNLYDRFILKNKLANNTLFMHDGVHPNKDGYKLWAETMNPTLTKLMNQ